MESEDTAVMDERTRPTEPQETGFIRRGAQSQSGPAIGLSVGAVPPPVIKLNHLPIHSAEQDTVIPLFYGGAIQVHADEEFRGQERDGGSSVSSFIKT